MTMEKKTVYSIPRMLYPQFNALDLNNDKGYTRQTHNRFGLEY